MKGNDEGKERKNDYEDAHQAGVAEFFGHRDGLNLPVDFLVKSSLYFNHEGWLKQVKRAYLYANYRNYQGQQSNHHIILIKSETLRMPPIPDSVFSTNLIRFSYFSRSTYNAPLKTLFHERLYV